MAYLERHWNPATRTWEYDVAKLERQAEINARANQIVADLRARQDGASIVEGMFNALEDRGAKQPRSTWPAAIIRHDRAAEHVVLDTTGAATVSAPFAVGTSWVAELAEAWTLRAMPIVSVTSIAELGDLGRGMPAIPAVTTAPEAGPQSGEKQEAHSAAFTVGPATNVTTIDSTLYLNWSMQLEGLAPVAADLGRAMQRAAVADEADRQVGAAIIAEGTAAADLAAGFAVFDTGRHLPSILLVPPSGIDTTPPSTMPSLTDLAAIGVRTVLAHVSKAVLLAPAAVVGWLTELQLTAPEPSRLGTGRAFAMWGKVAVDPAGVAVIG